MRWFVRFAYKGTRYHGSQSQPAGGTVQDTMEQAFALVLRRAVMLAFAGRTDAGVHAETMWAHFDIAPEEALAAGFDLSAPNGRRDLLYRLNRLLPADIALHTLLPVTDTAHARFDATARTYHYRITTRKDPFTLDLRTQVRGGLDFAAMNEAAQYLLGRQDFSSFCRVRTDVKTKFCTVTRAEWIAESETGHTFVITADRFLRNMVRAVTGTLFDVGYGKTTPSGFAAIIAQQNRQSAGESAPAQGLYLVNIQYPPSLFLTGSSRNPQS